MKAVVAAFNQQKALVGAFSVITNLRMDLLEALLSRLVQLLGRCPHQYPGCHNYITITRSIVTSVTVIGLISSGNLW